MKYLLDTDHLSILQRQNGQDYHNLMARMATKRMARLVSEFKVMPIVSFDAGAATAFEQLQAQRIQLAKMDARIAAIALSRGLILLTRNSRDFGKVVGIKNEDWTM